jgi:protein-S-isoprenylcysteine O-methyltransferase Ste14
VTDDHAGTKSPLSYVKLVLQGLFSLLLVLAMLFLSAGSIAYWQGWVFCGVTIFLVILQVFLFSGKSDLVKERMKPGAGMKWWDKIFYSLYIPAFFAVVIVASLDAGRFGWTPHFSPLFSIAFYIISYFLYIFSLFLYTWGMWTNTFFSSVVRLQSDRGQEVVQRGPYRVVRHPGYVAGILMAISISLVLGSLWGLVPACVVLVLLVIRTYLEDTTLQRELAGYADYARKVRYRLLPGIW